MARITYELEAGLNLISFPYLPCVSNQTIEEEECTQFDSSDNCTKNQLKESWSDTDDCAVGFSNNSVDMIFNRLH